jgi:hypothetical protein
MRYEKSPKRNTAEMALACEPHSRLFLRENQVNFGGVEGANNAANQAMPDACPAVRSPPLAAIAKPLALGGVLWLVLLVVGTVLTLRFEYTPGASGRAPRDWPVASRLSRAPGKATLLMFAHPKCVCSRASVGELAALVAENPGRMTTHVVFLKLGNSGDEPRTELWRSAAAIPGAIVSADDGGAEAARFGSDTSGDVLLYDAAGRLKFHGGITAARGHAGESAGQTALDALLAGNQTPETRTPVFGCPLTGPGDPRACQP